MIEKIAILKSEIESDRKMIQGIFSRFDNAYKEFSDSKEYAKLVESAFYLSQLYSGFESIFKNVARTFENDIEQDYWHKSLLERMKLEIEDLRQRLISDESYRCLDELRVFRHFFRHAYGMDLDKEKFEIVAKKALKLMGLYNNDLENFLDFLDAIKK
jgi:hypothetical protein